MGTLLAKAFVEKKQYSEHLRYTIDQIFLKDALFRFVAHPCKMIYKAVNTMDGT
jgi:hypothetical protein